MPQLNSITIPAPSAPTGHTEPGHLTRITECLARAVEDLDWIADDLGACDAGEVYTVAGRLHALRLEIEREALAAQVSA